MGGLSPQWLEQIDVAHLPSPPHTLLRLLETCNKEGVAVGDVAKILDKDAALATRVLALAHSPAYQQGARVRSLDQALMVLGLDAARGLALNASVYQVFSQLAGPFPIDLQSFWWHALLCASVAKLVAKREGYGHPDEAYVGGLLHDIGRLVLAANFPGEFAGLAAGAPDGHGQAQAERAALGASHPEVGAWLVARWEMQSFLADAILYHHDAPELIRPAHPLLRFVHFGSHLADLVMEDRVEGALAQAQAVFGYGEEQVREIARQALAYVMRVARAFEIDGMEALRGTPTGRAKPGAEKQAQLAALVRDHALVDAMRTCLIPGPADERDAWIMVEQAAHLLFGVEQPYFFVLDPRDATLRGRNPRQPRSLVNDWVIPADAGASLLGQALETRLPADSFAPGRARRIFDEQLIRLSNAEGIVCLPIYTKEALAGVMVFGTSRARLPLLERQYALMSVFSRLAGDMLIADPRTRPPERGASAAQEELAALKAEARRVIHEINNPLAIMKNYLMILQMKLGDADPAQNDLAILSEEIDRVGRIVRGFSGETQEGGAVPERVDVNAVISDLLAIVRPSLFSPNAVTAHVRLDDGVKPVEGVADRVKELFLNLFKNAAEAMPLGGELWVETRAGRTAEDKAEVVATVRDDGPGIPASVMSRLFDPVDSTKGAGHAGLGLSIVKRTVSALKGQVRCKSAPGQGTLFEVRLPAVES
ncbi:MAG: HDOD domain-containing protein [Betaproteobacteria bacterium]|nr:HDOD domain-containing protein [Betaproteobacteria bacterium]